MLFLPTYTAIAWYHQRLEPELQADLGKTLEEVRRFAASDYNLALAKGDKLAGEEKAEIVRQLARYTGLSPEYIEQTNLRIHISRFVKELLRDQRRTVGRLDGRFIGIDRDSAGERYDFDPSMAAIMGPYTATLNDYIRRELGFESDVPYEILTGRVRPWSFKKYENEFVDVAETLRSAMTANQNLKVHVANGYYDLATPFFATEYTFNHLQLDPALRGNISMSYYEAGHMMYIRESDLNKLADTVRAFIRNADGN
jgi:carboxypeptidase C (cathepsin A)